MDMHQHLTIDPRERGWAVIAHLSGLAGYLLPFFGIIAPIVIIFAREDSPVISAIAKQALFLNLAIFLCTIPIFILALTVILIPLTWVMSAMLSIIAFGLPVYGAIKASNGEFFEYPIVGRAPMFHQR
jgi:uncharacterized Tic20 family protein